jgi:hypothetical protein
MNYRRNEEVFDEVLGELLMKRLRSIEGADEVR